MNAEALGYPMHERERERERLKHHASFLGIGKRSYVNPTHGYEVPCMT